MSAGIKQVACYPTQLYTFSFTRPLQEHPTHCSVLTSPTFLKRHLYALGEQSLLQPSTKTKANETKNLPRTHPVLPEKHMSHTESILVNAP